jgi:hypothetical protein
LDKLAELSVPFGTEFERVGDRAQLLLDR